MGLPDNSLSVAGLTGVTAIVASSLASWLTSRGNAHAARIQVEASTVAQRREAARQTRRAAYLALIEQAQTVAEGLTVVAGGLAMADGPLRHQLGVDSEECGPVLEAHRDRHQHPNTCSGH
ncbi:hypothetical protein [Streptomyces sp. NPDC094472]|uniref:hypothetical protein n=1 Tax=unclassified Streptomyces TaxID=2593676 RepID=UPI0033289D3B